MLSLFVSHQTERNVLSMKRKPLIRKELAPFSELDMDYLATENDFAQKCQITGMIDEDNNSKTMFVKNLTNTGYSIAKIYDCYDTTDKKIKQKVNKYWNQYQIIKYSGLNEYFGLYYDDKTYQLIIHQQCYQQTLANYIATNGPMRQESAVKTIMHDLLIKLQHLHKYGYVHCHLKPNNIMERRLDHLYTREFIKDGWLLIDFDSMQRSGTKTSYKGSMGWTSPEIDIDSNKNRYDPSSDIFSFGLIILFVMFGSQPLQIPLKKQTQTMIREWYYKHVIQSENLIKNYLVKLFYDNKISLHLFELLHDGLLVFDAKKRWSSKQILECKWFN
eukprot:30378_1